MKKDNDNEQIRNDFLKEYRLKHLYCPKCGCGYNRITLAGYILDMDNKEEYKDLNKSECLNLNCKDIHKVNDRLGYIITDGPFEYPYWLKENIDKQDEIY